MNGDIFCRTLYKNGGVAIFCRNNFVSSPIPCIPDNLLSEKNFELAVCSINIADIDCVLICVYRSPQGDFDLFLRNLDILLDIVFNWKPNLLVILSGDFNCNLLIHGSKQNNFLNLLNSYQLNVHSYAITRVSSTAALDLTISNIDTTYVESLVISSDISDHSPVISRFNIKHKSLPIYYQLRNFSDINIAHFNNLLRKETWSSVYTPNEFDLMFQAFYDKFIYYFNVAFPLTTRKLRKSPSKPWVSDEIRAYSTYLKDLYFLYNYTKNKDLEIKYKSMKKSYKFLLSSAKSTYNNHRLSNCSNKSREIWKIINESKKSSTNHVIDSPNPNILAFDFNQHFTSLPSPKQPIDPFDYLNIMNHASSLYLTPCLENELKSIIMNCGSKFSAGIDDVPNFLIQQSFNLIKDPLLHLINTSFLTGTFPYALKTSKVFPLYKRKGNSNDLNSYRPIALQTQFSKIFEKAFHKRLVSYLENCNILSPHQHGFRQNKSTTSAILQTISHLYSSLDSKLYVCGLFLDFSKAFDLVNHQLLGHKLDRIGIRGPPKNWLLSYLQDRSQQVTVYKDGVKYTSPPKTFNLGVPQGSVLGPTLFLIYINDLPSHIIGIPGSVLILYADDTNILFSSPSLESLHTNCSLC